MGRNDQGRPFSTASATHFQGQLQPFNVTERLLKGENVPVYMTVGAICLSVSLGILTGTRELLYAPNVIVNKRKRKEVVEVEEPDYVLQKSEKFIDKSIFRKLGTKLGSYSDMRRAMFWDTNADINQKRQAETLKSVGAAI